MRNCNGNVGHKWLRDWTTWLTLEWRRQTLVWHYRCYEGQEKAMSWLCVSSHGRRLLGAQGNCFGCTAMNGSRSDHDMSDNTIGSAHNVKYHPFPPLHGSRPHTVLVILRTLTRVPFQPITPPQWHLPKSPPPPRWQRLLAVLRSRYSFCSFRSLNRWQTLPIRPALLIIANTPLRQTSIGSSSTSFPRFSFSTFLP
jgi:hypothetical protein